MALRAHIEAPIAILYTLGARGTTLSIPDNR